ncbi:MCE family protein [Gordonia sp. zg691]|uniref:MlaD family protein n=1 Tax=Gordonia jinghuaiqii TaxID=2758710 RepID=UPI0016622C22|nr:MlaD family protein [Gordonia jinghuaiqii]MBD0862508.1 MCE family protein [Gordonia jinghuaiqii]
MSRRFRRRGGRPSAVLGLGVAAVLGVSGCGVGLEQVPLPAPGAADKTYTLSARFANALNLPEGAKVRVAGADVGSVAAMHAEDFTALVELRIQSSTELPVGTVAELRSATPLGDVFVALEPPPPEKDTGGRLQNGDVLEADQTSSAATVEEVLATSALLVNGGAIRNLTKIVNGLGAAVGENGQTVAHLVDESTDLISTLADRSGEINRAMRTTSNLTATLGARQKDLSDAISAAAPAVGAVSANTGQVLDMVSNVDRLTELIGRFPSVRDTDTRSTIDDMNKLSYYFNLASLNPDADMDAVNSILAPLIKAASSTSAHANIDIEAIALGVVDDPNHKADPGMRVPDATDVVNVIGSLTYLLDKLYRQSTGGR